MELEVAGRSAPTDWKATACILCECSCSVEARLGDAEGRSPDRIRGDNAPVERVPA